MATFTDQLGQIIEISFPPRRIISLVPSQTEFLHAIGLDAEVIGITKYCVHPEEWFHSKPHVGGTKNFDVQRIIDMQPDLVIANKEENDKARIDALSDAVPVWVSDIVTLDDAYAMMEQLGKICDKEEPAQRLVSEIQTSFSAVTIKPGKTVLYFIWGKPWMVAGNETFINEMLQLNGLRNLATGRYPQFTLEEIAALNPDVIMLSSEPFAFRDKHRDELQQVLPSAKILFVDGEMFSWYGSRLAFSASYFNQLSI